MLEIRDKKKLKKRETAPGPALGLSHAGVGHSQWSRSENLLPHVLSLQLAPRRSPRPSRAIAARPEAGDVQQTDCKDEHAPPKTADSLVAVGLSREIAVSAPDQPLAHYFAKSAD